MEGATDTSPYILEPATHNDTCLQHCRSNNIVGFRIDSTVIGMTVVDCWRSLKLQSNNKAMRALWMVDFADWLAWDLLNNEMNSEPRTIIVPSVSTAGSTGNSIRSAISASDSSSVSFLLSPASDGSTTPSLMPLLRADIERHTLVWNEDLNGSGHPRWRRCCIDKCRQSNNKGGCPKVPYMCDHPAKLPNLRIQSWKGDVYRQIFLPKLL